MTGPDILPHIGDLFLLALFIVGAGAVTVALWLQSGTIDRQEQRIAELDERVSHQEVMSREMAELLERFVGTLVNDAIGGNATRKANGYGGRDTEGRA